MAKTKPHPVDHDSDDEETRQHRRNESSGDRQLPDLNRRDINQLYRLRDKDQKFMMQTVQESLEDIHSRLSSNVKEINAKIDETSREIRDSATEAISKIDNRVRTVEIRQGPLTSVPGQQPPAPAVTINEGSQNSWSEAVQSPLVIFGSFIVIAAVIVSFTLASNNPATVEQIIEAIKAHEQQNP